VSLATLGVGVVPSLALEFICLHAMADQECLLAQILIWTG